MSEWKRVYVDHKIFGRVMYYTNGRYSILKMRPQTLALRYCVCEGPPIFSTNCNLVWMDNALHAARRTRDGQLACVIDEYKTLTQAQIACAEEQTNRYWEVGEKLYKKLRADWQKK